MGFTLYEERIPSVDMEPMDSAWGLAPITVFGNSDRIIRLDSWIVTSDDTVDTVLQVWGSYSAVPTCLLGSAIIPAGAGTDGVTPAVELTQAIFPQSGTFIAYREFGLAIAPVAAISAGKHVYATTMGGII